MAKCLTALRMMQADDKIINKVRQEFHFLQDDLLSVVKEKNNAKDTF